MSSYDEPILNEREIDEQDYYDEYNSFDDYGNPDETYYEINEHTWLDGDNVYSVVKESDGDDYFVIHKKNGLLHRDDGPALFESINDSWEINNYWFCNGQLHNTQGIALQTRDHIDDVYRYDYYISGVKYSRENYEQKIIEMRQNVKMTLYENLNMCKDICGIISTYII